MKSETDTLINIMIRGKNSEAKKLQKAWTRSGDFANRSQYIKAAVNAYANEKIFELKEVKE